MQLSTPLDQRILRIDKKTLDRFVFCGRVRATVFHSWKQVCEYISVTDKIKMKELADKNMVLRSRKLP